MGKGKLKTVLILLLIALGITLFLIFNYVKNQKDKNLRASLLLSEIEEKFEKGGCEKILEDIKLFLKVYRDTPSSKVALSFLIRCGEDQRIDELLKKIKDENLKSLYLERKAYWLYKDGKYEEALKILRNIGKDSPNYLSKRLLEAFLYEKLGKVGDAIKIYNEILTLERYSYYGNIAYVKIKLLGLNGNISQFFKGAPEGSKGP